MTRGEAVMAVSLALLVLLVVVVGVYGVVASVEAANACAAAGGHMEGTGEWYLVGKVLVQRQACVVPS